MCETDVKYDDVSETEITNKKTNKHLQMGASGKKLFNQCDQSLLAGK